MRRPPLVVRALLAFAIFWMAGDVVVHAAPSDVRGLSASIHRDATALAAPHALLGNVTTPKRAHAPDWASRLGIPSRAVLLGDARFLAPSAFTTAGVRDGALRTVTYDATAPPNS